MASKSTKMPDDFNIYYLLKGVLPLETSEEPMDESRDETNPQYQGLTGLRNLGNTCYMNAVIQCLSSVSPLVEYFLSGKYTAALDKDNGEIATAFAYLMNDMWLGDFDCVSPEVFRLVIGERYPAFIKKTQQDAQEFLIHVLNELHEALKKVSKKRNQGTSSSTWDSRASYVSESSIITRLFEGHLSYDIICLECQNTTYKNEIFTVLSLPIPYETECSLEVGVTSKSMMAYKFVLIILGASLYMNKYSSLKNVVNHFGDLDGGHYTAFCKHTLTQSWYSFDDSQISEISECDVHTSAAYLLFYSSQTFSVPVKTQNG
uniref:ubiquitinyl hydrolase 1 n=1 Tax=Anolis carolinensis TaxID=28377 RepID=H9G8C0_ANOCA